ncbi:MAG: DUF5106 domain-containing protein [Bacteroidales bacterium]|nr:DUF5106 domain-containing protein [Bacteroidales bacterium]
MKKLFLSAFIAFLGSLSITHAGSGFELTVKIHGYPEGETVRLGRHFGTQTLLVPDTAVFDARRGVFVFRRDEPLQGGMYMLVSHQNFPAEFIVDQYQHFSMELRYPEFGADVVFTGSPENQTFADLNAATRPLHQRIGELRRQHEAVLEAGGYAVGEQLREINERIQETAESMNQLRIQFMEDNPTHLMTAVFRAQRDIDVPEAPDYIPEDERNNWRYNYFKDNFFTNMDLSESRLLRTPIFHQRLVQYLDRVLVPSPDSLISGIDHLISQVRGNPELFEYVLRYTTDRFMRSQIIGHDAIWVHLVDKYYLTGEAFWVSEATLENFRRHADRARPLLIGNIPKEFWNPDTNAGRPEERFRSVFEATATHRYTVVLFWEPTCGHCRRMMPILRDFYYANREELDFEIFAVCHGCPDLDAWRDYINTNNMTSWINVNGRASNIQYNEYWDVHSVPTIFIIDNQRRIVTRRIDVEQIEPFIRNWNAIHFSD